MLDNCMLYCNTCMYCNTFMYRNTCTYCNMCMYWNTCMYRYTYLYRNTYMYCNIVCTLKVDCNDIKGLSLGQHITHKYIQRWCHKHTHHIYFSVAVKNYYYLTSYEIEGTIKRQKSTSSLENGKVHSSCQNRKKEWNNINNEKAENSKLENEGAVITSQLYKQLEIQTHILPLDGRNVIYFPDYFSFSQRAVEN